MRKHILVAAACAAFLLLGIWLGVSADPYRDIDCADSSAPTLNDPSWSQWSQMHVSEFPQAFYMKIERRETLECKAYVRGFIFEFTANQWWARRYNPSVKTIHKGQ